jgi:3D (Asp-Asp-Asp) domain-containing protein
MFASAIAVISTAYCLTGTMSDGSYTRPGSVASNDYPLGTHLIVSNSPTKRKHWIVRDHIGWGTQLDFWVPTCWQARQWGRRAVHIKVHIHKRG